MAQQANIYEAKTRFSELVERAERGEDVVIARAGRPVVKLVAIDPPKKPKKRVFGQNVLGITYIAPDFDAPMTKEELKDWGL